MDELLRKIAATTHSLVAFDAFSILLLDAERKVLRHRFSERYDQRVDLDNIPLGKGITGAAAESREIVRVTDTLADHRYIASHPDIRSEIAVPLMVQDRVVGVMNLESERMGYFTEEHSRTAGVARSADRQFRRKCALVRRNSPTRTVDGSRFEGRAQRAVDHAAARSARD